MGLGKLGRKGKKSEASHEHKDDSLKYMVSVDHCQYELFLYVFLSLSIS